MMADAAVDFLTEKLKQLLIHRGHLFSDEVEKLDDHLLRFKASIRDAPKQQGRRDELLAEPINRIRLAVYDAEDTIDAHIIEKNPVNESAPNIAVRTVEEIGAALEQIRCIYTENSSADSNDSDSDSDFEDGVTGGEIQIG